MELAEWSQQDRRRYLPSASASSGGGSHCQPRISSWTEAQSAAAEMSLSPVQNSELCLAARYFRPWINSRWELGCRPGLGHKRKRRFSPASKASSVDGSLCPARKTSTQHGHLAPETALSRARRAPDWHLAPETGLSRARRAPDWHLAPETCFLRARRALVGHLAPETALSRAGRALGEHLATETCLFVARWPRKVVSATKHPLFVDGRIFKRIIPDSSLVRSMPCCR